MREIEDPESLAAALREPGPWRDWILQDLDLGPFEEALSAQKTEGWVLLGCRVSFELESKLRRDGAVIFPALPKLPYTVFRSRLYSPLELYQGMDPEIPESYPQSLDGRVYAHWKNAGRARPHSPVEALAQRLHDFSMTDALETFLESQGRPVVAVMGGHGLERGDASYQEVARLGRELAQREILVLTGGGPGAMEAAHLGAWMSARPDADLERAFEILAEAPRYDHPKWIRQAFRVRAEFPRKEGLAPSGLGIPTWLYGHEPPHPFATHVAKYFANSIREEGLVTEAHAGIVFAPGSAGTIQEIFQDACQNHYEVTGFASPMVFLGREYWTQTKPVYPLLKTLAEGKPYGEMLALVDRASEVVSALEKFLKRTSEG